MGERVYSSWYTKPGFLKAPSGFCAVPCKNQHFRHIGAAQPGQGLRVAVTYTETPPQGLCDLSAIEASQRAITTAAMSELPHFVDETMWLAIRAPVSG
jgi:hypothetical protein